MLDGSYFLRFINNSWGSLFLRLFHSHRDCPLGVALPLFRDAFLDLGDNTALGRWWTARSINVDAEH